MVKSSYKWETFGILVLVIAAIRIFYQLRMVPWLAPYVPLLVAAILIYVPILHSQRRRERITYLDRSWSDLKRSLVWFGVATIIILPSFLIGNQYWQEWVMNRAFMPRMVPELWLVIFDQLFLVALPEELFFRGWFQDRMNRIFPSKWSILGARLGWGWIGTALFFAAAHSVIHYQWWHFAIFFPALLFGWLRERTGTVTAPSLWHALGNIATFWIGISYV